MMTAMVSNFGGRSGGGKTARAHQAIVEHLLKVPDAVIVSMAAGKMIRARLSDTGTLVWEEVQTTTPPARPLLIDELTAATMAGDFDAQPCPVSPGRDRP